MVSCYKCMYVIAPPGSGHNKGVQDAGTEPWQTVHDRIGKCAKHQVDSMYIIVSVFYIH